MHFWAHLKHNLGGGVQTEHLSEQTNEEMNETHYAQYIFSMSYDFLDD
jgi:hypothetical protein